MASVRNDPQPATDHLATGLTPDESDVSGEPDSSSATRRALLAGHRHDQSTAMRMLEDPDPTVRVVALGALSRSGVLTDETLINCLTDSDWHVRRRACEVIPRREGSAVDESVLIAAVVSVLADPEALVAESAAWALGELVPRDPHVLGDSRDLGDANSADPPDVLGPLEDMVLNHRDPLCREAAVAAVGAIGDLTSLDTVLLALEDKPPIRRRAAVALAAFDDPRADEALERCLNDRDWQVRQAAEDLRPRP